jgi:hypothetical protein
LRPIRQRRKVSPAQRRVTVELGGFEFLNLADLTWKIGQALVCPSNLLGKIDLSQVTHHGGNVNNNPLLLRSLRPSVAVMINGPRKGEDPDTVKCPALRLQPAPGDSEPGRSGLTPYAALAAATRNPAEHLRALDTIGTIERGKRADLVLLNVNPLDDITGTERRTGVMVRGKWISAAESKKMLDDAAIKFQQAWGN